MAEENCRTLDIDFMGTIAENDQTEEEKATEPRKEQSLAKNLASCDWYSIIAGNCGEFCHEWSRRHKITENYYQQVRS